MPTPRRTICLSGGQAPCGGVEEGGPLEPKLNALSKLQALCLYSAELTDALTRMQTPNLANDKMKDATNCLHSITNLRYLHLAGMQVTSDFSCLNVLSKLQTFCFYGTKMAGDIKKARGLMKLQTIDLDNTKETGEV